VPLHVSITWRRGFFDRNDRRHEAGFAFALAICTLNRRALLERAMRAVQAQMAAFPKARIIVVIF
jgi:hypothetical protein